MQLVVLDDLTPSSEKGHVVVHECIIVLTGKAHIHSGVADAVDGLKEIAYDDGREKGGVEVEVKVGDVFVILAGMALKTFGAQPEADLNLMTLGQGHDIKAQDRRGTLES
ncbi:hypothetical protein PFICI_11877 [Pestalotiopsis fici W106-1]|uniref:Uncharacterized protein n=1 Tax=Pestalotiopsis fici (strain W106-1 / CGMCC3.15140) TaxID=1229662 RepID=W3WRJ7_PESFW|nr:uncharacterized protein PFICI_11877 [Pestalotiopsis fici W106-1]ETS76490.1 hypothetical protein PFICI_11877 [Pestalotiopsis fici W106-1]